MSGGTLLRMPPCGTQGVLGQDSTSDRKNSGEGFFLVGPWRKPFRIFRKRMLFPDGSCKECPRYWVSPILEILDGDRRFLFISPLEFWKS